MEKEKVVKNEKMEGFLVFSRTPEEKVYLEIWAKSNKLLDLICDSPECGNKVLWYNIPKGDFVMCDDCFNDFKDNSMAFWIPFKDISVAGFEPRFYYPGD